MAKGMVDWADIRDLDELIRRLDEDEPRRRERMARGRAHLDQALRYLGFSEEEIASARSGRKVIASPRRAA